MSRTKEIGGAVMGEIRRLGRVAGWASLRKGRLSKEDAKTADRPTSAQAVRAGVFEELQGGRWGWYAVER